MKILDVTAVMINVGPIEPLIKAMDDTVKTIEGYFGFKHYMIITEKDITHDKYEIKKCPELNRQSYNLFHVKHLWQYFSTSHFLILHTDSHIIHPELWNDEWMQYDYIAAPWSNGDIGGGGFSLRSVKLAYQLSQVFANISSLSMHEDGYYASNSNIDPLMKYPSTKEALKFCQETLFDPTITPFGIHNPKMPEYNTYNYWLNTLKNK